MTSFQGKFLSRKKKGLHLKLLVVEALVFVIPFLIFSYIFNKNNIHLDRIQMLIIALILVLILGGLIMLRQIFDRFYNLASSMKKALSNENGLSIKKRDTDELLEITASFEGLMKKFEDTTGELGYRIYELLAIRELIEAAAKSSEIDELLNVLLEKVMAVTHSQTGSVFRVEHDTDRFRLITSRGLPSDTQKDLYLNIKDSISQHVVRFRQPMLVENIETDTRTRRPNNMKYGSPSFLVMPVFAKDQLIATLNLSQKEENRIYNINDKQIASIMIGEVGFALENILLHSEIQSYIESLKKRTSELEGTNSQLNNEIDQRKQTETALNQAYEDLKQTQAQLVQTGKLSSIGELAAGVAHELNQPLMVIRGHAQMLLRNRKPESKEHESLQMIEKNTKRVMKIIDHLRTFSRQSKSDFRPVELTRMINEAFLLVAEQLRLSEIEIEKILPDDLPKAVGDANQLEQFLLNLITNAKDAIEKRRKRHADAAPQKKRQNNGRGSGRKCRSRLG